MENNNKYIIPIAVLIAGALIGWGFYTNKNSNPDTETPPNQEQEIPAEDQAVPEISFRESDHILGNVDAIIKIITFSDFECPYCKTFHETMLQITSEYAKDGTIAWAFRQFPVHGAPTETKAAATECAGQLGGESKFWEMAEKIFETTTSGWITVEEIPAIAIGLGLDEGDFKTCLENPDIISKVQTDFDEAVSLEITGTPTSIVFLESGEIFPINGAQPYEAIKGMVDMILADQVSTE